jgi:hypothetical protein
LIQVFQIKAALLVVSFIPPVDNTNWLNPSIIRDTLPIKRPATDSTNILTYRDIAIKQERNYLDKDFVIVGDLLNPGNLRLLV